MRARMARTSSRVSTTGRRAGVLARIRSSSHGSSCPSTSRYRNRIAAKCLVLRRGRDPIARRERAEKGGHFLGTQLNRVAPATELVEADHPAQVGLLGPG